jgi:hypothetical protein
MAECPTGGCYSARVWRKSSLDLLMGGKNVEMILHTFCRSTFHPDVLLIRSIVSTISMISSSIACILDTNAKHPLSFQHAEGTPDVVRYGIAQTDLGLLQAMRGVNPPPTRKYTRPTELPAGAYL